MSMTRELARNRQQPPPGIVGQCGHCHEVLYKDPETGELYTRGIHGLSYRCYTMCHVLAPDSTDSYLAILSS